MSDPITNAVLKQFERHRLVFWHDEKSEMLDNFESLELEGIEKLRVENNEFGLKRQVLKLSPKTKFLIYRGGTPPEDIDNWLLDLELYSGKLRLDNTGLILEELGLVPNAQNQKIAEDQAFFFNNKKRLEAFKSALRPEQDDYHAIKHKILMVCVGASSPKLEDILEELLGALSRNDDRAETLIKKCNLEKYLWDLAKDNYGYNCAMPNTKDFAMWLFKSCFDEAFGGQSAFYDAKKAFMQEWKDNRHNIKTFMELSGDYANDLGIESKLENVDYKRLLYIDYFEIIERKIIVSLAVGVLIKTIGLDECSNVQTMRRKSAWIEKYQFFYDAIEYASQFLRGLELSQFKPQSFDDGVKKYSENWYQLDFYYRKFIYSYRQTGANSVLGDLFQAVENGYNNSYILELSDNWQGVIDKQDVWQRHSQKQQRKFFEQNIKPIIDSGKKICVIISDAMRYEIGHELVKRVQSEDRFDASIEPMISQLPSYTQLGMAALLPNETLAFKDDDSGHILVDNKPSNGTEYRAKILKEYSSTAIQYKDVFDFNSEAVRDLLRNNQCVYIYHNVIDKTGDNKETEPNVFEAAETAINEIVGLIKKLTGNNANNLIVTADHGFLFQYSELQASDYLGAKAAGENLLYQDRRFVLGKGFEANNSFKHFNAKNLGLEGDMEVIIPKSTNRLLRKGSGSRFVHGGASLQEIIIPLLRVNKKRQSDTSRVDVEVLANNKNITSGQFSVVLHQKQAVTEKMKAISLKIGLYAKDGMLLSNSFEEVFDIADDEPRKREHSLRFVLKPIAASYNNQEVYLVLNEDIQGTTQQREYSKVAFNIKRSINTDFDF